MPVRSDRWPAGTPNWVDLAVKDLPAALRFYGELFGWEFIDTGDEGGGYRLAVKGGEQVAGIGEAQDDAWPVVWTTYLASDDADATGVHVLEEGGAVLAPAFDVLDSGRMLVAADPAGAAFGVWQARRHIGVGRYNEHGTLIWNELHTREFAGSKEFYSRVFGSTFSDVPVEGFEYATLDVDGRGVGGLQHDTLLPDGVPNYWLTWFGSDDVDATVAAATGLGSAVLFGPVDSPFGRMAIVQAPQGETFGILATGSADG